MLNGHVRGGQNPVKNRGKESLVQAFLPPKEFILQFSHSGLPGSSRSVEAVLVRDGDSRCVMHLLRPNFLQRRGFFDSFESFDDVANLDVIEVFKAHAALIALDHFLGVILEALE